MNFKYINKLIFLFIIFLISSCQTIERLNERNKVEEFDPSNESFEYTEAIDLANHYESSLNFNDYYTDTYENITIDNNIDKKFTINNYGSKYYAINPIKIYIIDNFLYSIDSKAKFNIYNLEDGKLIQSVKLKNNSKKNIPIPTSLSVYNNNFIIGFKNSEIMMVDMKGKILWEIKYNNILSTSLKIYNDSLILIFGDTIKSISLNNGSENWSLSYDGSSILDSKGGSIIEFVNLLYFLLPNASVGEVDTLFMEKNISNFNEINFKSTLNNYNHELYNFNNNVVYFDGKKHLSTYDIFTNEIVLSDFEISNVSSFEFYNNAFFVKVYNNINAYNIKNGKLFWSINIDKIINEKAQILKIASFDNNIYIFFDNGKILVINDGKIINTINLKIKNINMIYFQKNRIFASLDNGKTILF